MRGLFVVCCENWVLSWVALLIYLFLMERFADRDFECLTIV